MSYNKNKNKNRIWLTAGYGQCLTRKEVISTKQKIQKKQPELLFVTTIDFRINNKINLYYFSVVHLST
jgi:hypothetical protein